MQVFLRNQTKKLLRYCTTDRISMNYAMMRKFQKEITSQKIGR